MPPAKLLRCSSHCSIFVTTVVNTDPRQAMATIPMTIFTYSESPSSHDQQVAWAAALVLIAVVLIGSIVGQAAVRQDPPPDRARAMTDDPMYTPHKAISHAKH